MSKPNLTLEIDTSAVRKAIVDFIRRQIHGAGFEKAVLGLSGGLDSSLACMLTAEAMGPENVLALRMPYRTSPPDTLEHAALIIQATGVQERTVPISAMVDPLFEHFPEAGQIRRGNAMARARMIVLYDQSAAFKGLVVGTGNKTEILLGYSTLYGDSACALVPLGDLYKTQVRQLSRAVGIPEVILAKPPSADLWVGQTDEGELGFTYAEVDKLLLLLVDGRYTRKQCIAEGFEGAFIDEVMDRMRRYRFKSLMPPVAELGESPMEYDFLFARDWGS